MVVHSVSVCVRRIMKGMKMNKRKIIQFCLVGISTATILEFYRFDFSPLIKTFSTVFLITINCAYSYHIGMKDGIEMSDRHNERMNDLRSQSFDKIVDMVVEEKTKDKAAE